MDLHPITTMACLTSPAKTVMLRIVIKHQRSSKIQLDWVCLICPAMIIISNMSIFIIISAMELKSTGQISWKLGKMFKTPSRINHFIIDLNLPGHVT